MQPPPDQDIIIIGATGDLARRKLLPAIYDLAATGLLPGRGRIVGMTRQDLAQDDFRDLVHEAVRSAARTGFDASAWQALARRLSYARLGEESFSLLRQTASERRLVYLATPPDSFAGLAATFAAHGLAAGSSIVIEKPFGKDLQSGKALNRDLHGAFDESQIYRIDHYLGKETVQNVLVFRFANSVFERVWNRDAVEHIQITVAETIGIEGRGAFYDGVGALRDVLQNHVLQLLAILTMEAPASFSGEAVRDEKTKLLRALRPLRPQDVVRGQYTAGMVDGEKASGYREEEGVDAASQTETYVAARLSIDNWRWAGVPVVVRTGKRLAEHRTEIEVAFHAAPPLYFEGAGVSEPTANRLVLSIQPRQEIAFSFLAKTPGSELDVRPAELDFSFDEGRQADPAEAYERLLYDAMRGDHTLFVREDAIERAWQVVQPVLDDPPPLHLYPAGAWGPAAADELIAPHLWRR